MPKSVELELKHGEYYWVYAPSFCTDDDEEDLIIAQFSKSPDGPSRWYVEKKRRYYNENSGRITPISKISRPKINRNELNQKRTGNLEAA